MRTGTIKANADILYSNINNYIDKLHELIREMLNSLGTLSNILVTKNNTYTEITNYYSNNTSSSYASIIRKMKSILANYYIREFSMVYPKIQEIINLFDQNTNETLKDEISYIKDLYDKLQKKIHTIAIKNHEAILYHLLPFFLRILSHNRAIVIIVQDIKTVPYHNIEDQTIHRIHRPIRVVKATEVNILSFFTIAYGTAIIKNTYTIIQKNQISV